MSQDSENTASETQQGEVLKTLKAMEARLEAAMQKKQAQLLRNQVMIAYQSGQRDFRRLDLTGTNLNWASLEKANLKGADLYEATLSGALLAGANLEGALLAGANLEGADLAGANLKEAILAGANLDNVFLGKGASIPPNFPKGTLDEDGFFHPAVSDTATDTETTPETKA